MELINDLKDIILNSKEIINCKNFYFENHICEVDGNTKKVQLNYTLACDLTDKIMKFGKCNDCGTLFYSYDYSSKSF